MVWEAAKSVKIPVIGMGGIRKVEDVVEFMIAGASLVQVGTTNFVNPRATLEVLEGMESFMREERIRDLQEIRGKVQSV